MQLPWRKEKKMIPRSGYRRQIMPIVEKGMSDFLLRISVNSSFVALGICDIISESFYEYSVARFLHQIPKHLSFPTDFSPYLKPFVSLKFKDIVYSDRHQLIIGSFYKYYIVRLPVLIHHVTFETPIDKKKSIGPSEDDLQNITSYSLARFKASFPTAAKEFMGDGLAYRGIEYQYAFGKDIAYKYKYEDDKLQEFLNEYIEVWSDVSWYFPKMRGYPNNNDFAEMVFKGDFGRFWNSYILDYMDTLNHWSFAGAFEDDGTTCDDSFWKSLEMRLDRGELLPQNYKGNNFSKV